MALAPLGSTDWVGGSFPSLSLLVWEMGWESGHLGSGSFCGVMQGWMLFTLESVT